jgi:hypothetical protein
LVVEEDVLVAVQIVGGLFDRGPLVFGEVPLVP